MYNRIPASAFAGIHCCGETSETAQFDGSLVYGKLTFGSVEINFSFVQTEHTRSTVIQATHPKETQPDPLFHALHGNLQCSPAAILQAANLYVFTMNNPVFWIDPSGLNAMPSHALGPALGAIFDVFFRESVGDNMLGILSGAVGSVQTPTGEATLFGGMARNQERFDSARRMGEEIARHDYYFDITVSRGLQAGTHIAIGYTWYFGLATGTRREYVHASFGVGKGVGLPVIDVSGTTGMVFNPTRPVDFQSRNFRTDSFNIQNHVDIAHFFHVNGVEWVDGATGMEITVQSSAGAGIQYTHYFLTRTRTIGGHQYTVSRRTP
ncbi:MAG: hypothetical protein FWC70_13355 [Defluviitaleaceae bacterium]|nr:hypothetical protein [Defluviitaleaceae bacterium]